MQITRQLESATPWTSTIDFSPDSSFLAAATRSVQVVVWDLATGEPAWRLNAHSENVLTLCYSPDGTRLVTGGIDRKVALWDTTTRRLVQTFDDNPSWVLAVAISHNNEMIAIASNFWEVQVRHTVTGERLQTLKSSNPGATMLFLPSGDLLLAGEEQDLLVLVDIPSGKTLRCFPSFINLLEALDMCPSFVVSSSLNCHVLAWDFPTGELAQVWNGHSKEITSVSISPDCELVVSSGEDGTFIMWAISSQ